MIRKLATLVLAATALAAVAPGCGSDGGGGGGAPAGGASGGSTSAGTGTGPTGPIANDFTAPDVSITKPARGQYFTATPSVVVEGRVSDAGSGVQFFELNGTRVSPDAQGNFAQQIALRDGVNIIVARGIDWAGNVGTASISVMESNVYRLATEDIPGAAASRLNEAAVNKAAPILADELKQSGVIQQKLTASPLFRDDVRDPIFNACIASAEVSVLAISFDTPQIHFDSIAGGFNANVHVPNLSVTARARSYCGIPYSVTGNFSSTDAVVDVGLDVALNTGHFAVTARQSSVVLNGFRWGITGIPTVITNLVHSMVKREVEERLRDAIQQQLPPTLANYLQSLAQPISRTFVGYTVAMRAEPQRLLFDDSGLQFECAGNVTTARNPAIPLVPGSVFLPPPAGAIPAFGVNSGVYASVNENLVNRALFASWQAGFWTLQIDTAFLAKFGLNLPVRLDAHLIASFFPQLAGMITPGASIDVALLFEPQMQPVMKVIGAPDLFSLEIGELHMTLLMDFGAGLQPVFKTALHLRGGANMSFANDAFTFTINPNVQAETDILNMAVPLGPIDIERFVAFMIPPALSLVTQTMQPIPLPTVQGLSLTNLQVYRDGAVGEFVTAAGDVK